MNNLSENFDFDEAKAINFVNLLDNEREMVRTWRNHDDVRKWMYTDHVISSEEHASFFETIKNDNRNFYWIIKGREDDYFGVVSLNRVDFRNKNSYFAIYANPYTKMPGAGRMFDKVVIKIAFEIFKFHSLRLEILEDNTSVINLHKKMGFKEEGRLKEHVFKDGRWKDVVVMGKTNDSL